MQLVINISKWPEDSPLEHINTDIFIKDENDVELFPPEKIYTNVWVKDIDIPYGSTYYIVERKNFKLKGMPNVSENLSYESIVHTVTNDDGEISNMLLKERVVVEKPTLFLKLKDIENLNKTVTIKGSHYRGRGDGHTHSHWVIKSDGIIKLKSLVDRVNKTSITVDKSVVEFENDLEIYLTYCSNNIESETLVYNVRKTDTNFKVISNLVNVPIEDYNLRISKIDTNKIMKLSKVNITQDDLILKTYNINGDSNIVNLVIPKNFIEPNGTLIIELYGYDSLDKLTKISYKLIPYNLHYEDNINKDYVYEGILYSRVFNTLVPKGLVTDNLNGNIIIPIPEGFRLRKYSDDTGITNVSTIDGLQHLNNIEDMLIRVNNDNTILIDCYNSSNKPTFLVYKYNSANNANNYLLVNMLVRNDETKTTSFNNSIEQINNDEFIYNVVGTDILKKYNKKTNVVTTLKNISIPNTTSITILKMDDNQLLCMANGDMRTKIYLIDKNKYIDGMILEFNKYHYVNIKKIDLINGDKLLVRNVVGDNPDKVLYFDISEYKLKELDYIIRGTNNNIILRNGNSVLIGNILERDYINYNQDRLELISFT